MRNKLPFRSSTAPTTAKLSALVAVTAVAAAITVASGVTSTTVDAATKSTTVVTEGNMVRYAGLSVRIPAAGQGVSASAISSSGDLSLTVSRDAAGKVTVRTDNDEHASQAQAASTTRAAAAKTCTDGAYELSGWKANSFSWYYNPAGAPAAIRNSAGSAITNATMALTKACGQTKKLALNPTFGGQTSVAPQVGAAGNCTGNDGKNVIGFRAGSGRWLGMTCTYFRTINGRKTVTGTDTALNTQYAFFTSTANCSNAYDLTSVVLHERGHSLGLNHVDQTSHASAVMTPALSPCSVGKRTMGLGDFRGLAALYGTR
jgi:hypothetical protein